MSYPVLAVVRTGRLELTSGPAYRLVLEPGHSPRSPLKAHTATERSGTMSPRVSRREFAKAAASASIAGAATACSTSDAPAAQPQQAANPAGQATARTFPKGFSWGVATASYQIEGAWN